MKKNVLCLFFILIFLPTFLSAQETIGPADGATERAGGVKSLENRIEQLEKAVDRPVASDRWYDRLKISGLVEVEAGYETIDFNDPTVED